MVEVAQGRLCNLRALLGLGMLIAMNLYACGAVRPNVLIILTDDQADLLVDRLDVAIRTTLN